MAAAHLRARVHRLHHSPLTVSGGVALAAVGAYAAKVGMRYWFSRMYYHSLVASHLEPYNAGSGLDALLGLVRPPAGAPRGDAG